MRERIHNVIYPKVKERLLGLGRPALGLFNYLPCPEAIECIARSGADFVVIDGEHGYMSIETMVGQCRAADAFDCIPIVRLVDHDPGKILQILDGGAKGIIIPRITCKEDVEAIVQATRYAPVGNRGFCPSSRGNGLGAFNPDKFKEWTNNEVLLIPLIEDIKAVECIDEICSVKGIDVIMIGPYDMSMTMGLNGDFTHPDVDAAMHKVLDSALAHGLDVWVAPNHLVPGGMPAGIEYWYNKGAKMFAVNGDAGCVFANATATLNAVYKRLQIEQE